MAEWPRVLEIRASLLVITPYTAQMDEVDKYLAKAAEGKEKKSILSSAKRLLFGGKQLADDCSLADYGIGDLYTIHEIGGRLRGGMPPTETKPPELQLMHDQNMAAICGIHQ